MGWKDVVRKDLMEMTTSKAKPKSVKSKISRSIWIYMFQKEDILGK